MVENEGLQILDQGSNSSMMYPEGTKNCEWEHVF